MAKGFKYIEVDSFKNLAVIKLANLDAFVKLAEESKPAHIFMKSDNEEAASANGEANEKGDFLSRTRGLINSVSGAGSKTEFYFVDDNTVYSVSGEGYKSIEDYYIGKEKNFKSGDDYYASIEGGFESQEDYQASLSDGFSSKEEFEKANNTGFIGGVAKLNAAKLAGELKDSYFNKVKNIKKDGDLYRYARKSGYDSFIEFKDAMLAGYVGGNAEEFRNAKKSGFSDAESFKAATEGSFDDPSEFSSAKELGIGSKTVFDRYKELDSIKADKGYGFFDQANVYDLLNNLESGKLISFGKLAERLKDSQGTVKAKVPTNPKDWLNVKITSLMKVNSLPEWFTTSFNSNDELKAFVINDENIQKLGEYDQNSDVFIRN